MRQHQALPDQPVTLVETCPTVDQYLHLREQVGWAPVAANEVKGALAASLYSLCAVHDNKVIACARIIGDGGLYFYVQDMIVDSDYRGMGIGTVLMRALLKWLAAHAGEGAFIGLMAAEGAAGFYRKFGFEERPQGRPGMSISQLRLYPGTDTSPSK